jgi:hypothetical protein
MAEPEDFKDALLRAAAKADALRAAGLKGLEGLTQARQAGLKREQGRLSQKLGAEHPRVRALAVRMEDGVARLRDLMVDIARAETVAPTAGAAEWVLHGYVRRKDLTPAPDLTVSLVDAQGQWIKALGFACTDARGYFQLVASLGGTEPPGKPEQPGKPELPGKPGPAGKLDPAGKAVLAPKLQAHVRITDRNRLQLYRGEEAVPISPGAVEYREIILEDGSAGCVAPEEGEVPSPTPGKKESLPVSAAKPRRRK